MTTHAECGPKVVRIDPEAYGKCARCGWIGRLDWQIMLPDGSWGFLCSPCGEKLEKENRKQ
jgi:MinD superfamily P-loop ATPase